MGIKEFCEKYSKIATENLKEKYLKDNLKIKEYISYLTKVTLAGKLTKVTMLDKDGNINVKSDVNYLLFCRMIIEQYTNLEVETDGFYEEYDALNMSGLLDKIMQMIPEKEIKEFKMLCDMKRDDLMFNQYDNHAFISKQVTRFSELLGATVTPVLIKISEEFEKMDEKELEKKIKSVEKILKVVK